MTLPDFLIIGAMKCGTTSLYRDLLTNPAIFMPDDKEPDAMCTDAIFTPAGRRAYERLFASARPEQCCGEASTSYTKAPDIADVPRRAQQVLGGDVRLIYVIREPIARIISHHHHAYSEGSITTPDINVAVREHPQLIAWSKYAMQAELWIEVFGRDALRMLRFEDFVADRRETITSLCTFLGVEPQPERIEVDAVHNRSEGKPVARGFSKIVAESALYRRAVRPFIPRGAKDRIRQAVLPKAPPRPDPPSRDTVEWVLGELADDLSALRALLGCDGDVWDFEYVRSRFG